MLSIGAMGNGQGGYYIGLASDDYYFNGGEPEGIWFGRGASALGLTGTVKNEQFLRVFHGFDPGSDRALIQNAGNANRQPGWDLTFSAPKSVSTLWAVLDQEGRKAIQDAQHAAVKEALQYIEDEAAYTRRGKGGLAREPVSLIIATFEHGTSRAQDPQLHTHSTVLNIGVRADGTTGSILSKQIYQDKMTIGALYRAHLAHRLELLGFRVERRGSTFEVVGVPDRVNVEFSKRRYEIQAILNQRGQHSAKASAIAALDSRQVKEHIAREQLFARWTEVAATLGFTQQDAKSLREFQNTRDAELESKSVISEAVKLLSSKVSHFTADDLLRAVSMAAPGTGLSASNLRDAVNRETSSGSLVSLGYDKGVPHFTTKEIIESERRLLTSVEDMNKQSGCSVPKDALLLSIQKVQDEETAKARKQDPVAEPRVLNSEQLAALAHVTDGRSRISVVSGMAGTGKTLMLAAARTAWEQQGYRVLGAAVAGKAARGLSEGAGIDSVTVSKLLAELEKGFDYEPDTKRKLLAELKHATWQIGGDTRKKMLGEYHKPTSNLDHEWKYATWQISKEQRDFLNYRLEREKYRLGANTVLVVDEAGMVGTRQMEALAKACNDAGAHLILTGDSRQIQPVDIGGPFNAIGKRIGDKSLTQIVRQELDKTDKNPYWRREAVHAFADGRAQDALSAYSLRGFLNVSQNRHGAMKALINKWQAASKDNPKENMIFAGTRREIEELNGLAQTERRKAGSLGFRSTRIGKQTIFERDRVIITQNKDALGVSNGDLGTVSRIELESGRMTVKLDSGRDVTIPFRTWQEIGLGYAVTSHKGQGVTVRNAFILCGGSMTDREITYVQASRARQDTHFFTEDVGDGDDRKQQATQRTIEELSRQMSRSRQKDLAHDIISLGQPEQELELVPVR